MTVPIAIATFTNVSPISYVHTYIECIHIHIEIIHKNLRGDFILNMYIHACTRNTGVCHSKLHTCTSMYYTYTSTLHTCIYIYILLYIHRYYVSREAMCIAH